MNDLYYRGGPFMVWILLVGLLGLNFTLVALAKTRRKSNYSQESARLWIFLAGMFTHLTALLGLLGYWQGIAAVKKASMLIGLEPASSALAYGRFEALIPLRNGLIFFSFCGMLFLISIWRANKLPERTQIKPGEIQPFSPAILIILHFLSIGLATHIKLSGIHGHLPRKRPDDPGPAKAFWFLFIPLYNIYWIFFVYLRLTLRLNEELEEKKASYRIPKELVLATQITTLIPYVNLIAFFILWPITLAMLQKGANLLSPDSPVLPPEAEDEKVALPRTKVIFIVNLISYVLIVLAFWAVIGTQSSKASNMLRQIEEKEIKEFPPPPPVPEPEPEEEPSEEDIEDFGVVGGVIGEIGPDQSFEVEEPVRLDSAPEITKRVIPVYPDIARKARIQGVVILELVIGTRGRPQKIKVLRSHPMLEKAAVDAVRQWEFKPAVINGKPREAVFNITVSFKLQNP